MRLIQSLSVAMVVLFAFPASGDDNKPEPTTLSGTFLRDTGDFTLNFTFEKKDVLTFKIMNSVGDGMAFVAKYTIDDKGKVEMTIRNSKKIGDFEETPSKGQVYTFTLKQAKDSLTLSDLNGEGADQARDIVEGEYKLKED